MTANQAFLLLLLITVIGTFALDAVALKFGLKWANVAQVSLRKAFSLSMLILIISMLASVAESFVINSVLPSLPKSFLLSNAPGNLAIVVAVISALAIPFAVPCLVVAIFFRVPIERTVKAIAPYAAVSLALIALSFAVVRPYAYEAFSISTNSMAPTLLGTHVTAPCPHCGEPAYGSPNEPRFFPDPAEPTQMICSKELQTVYVKSPLQTRFGGDRITVCKLLKPRRWDLIAFRNPEDPSVIYVKRVVGLPGEKIAIHDGAVWNSWIGGQKLEPPAEIRGIQYSPTLGANHEVSGPGSSPVELGSDEYYVIGDFVDVSLDSRLWKTGAPGHPPYAVPASYIVGVVINIYWPQNRWASFR